MNARARRWLRSEHGWCLAANRWGARAAVRASLGTGNTAAQVDGFLGALRATTTKLQHLTALAV